MNERKTEQLVRKLLTRLGYFGDKHLRVEEQISDIPRISKLLKNASKNGDGAGYPEFIITSTEYPELLIVIECKADVNKHMSAELCNYSGYAVDGALLYGSYLSREYDVVAIGVSGQTARELRISSYLILKGDGKPHELAGSKLLSFKDYRSSYREHPAKFNLDYSKLIKYSQTLNRSLHKNKVKESQRSLLISAVLIALKNDAFVAGYKQHRTAKQLAKSLVDTVINELDVSEIPREKIESLRYAYGFINTHSILSKNMQFLVDVIDEINDELNSFIRTHAYVDALGQFYVEFLRYANNDKGLGIVLTPPHITELFAELADINENSVVVDNCCGTSGFIISAMKKMVNCAKGNSRKIKKLKKEQLVGVESQDDIYALSVSNMVIHGDGKSNIINGDCFDCVSTVKERYRPTTGLLNPPYKSEKSDREELEFVLNNLEMIAPNGKCVAIIPLSSVLAQGGVNRDLKRRLLEHHSLDAVMSMPSDLFHNSKVGVVTAIIVVTAHKPHPKRKKTWFALWRDDGFVKVKNKGRIDLRHTWKDLEARWLSTYFNKEVIDGYSVMRAVNCSDEWCAEAYLETDYSDVTEELFIDEMRKYVAFNISHDKQ